MARRLTHAELLIVEVAAAEDMAIFDLQHQHQITPQQARLLHRGIYEARQALIAQARGEAVDQRPPLCDWLERCIRECRP